MVWEDTIHLQSEKDIFSLLCSGLRRFIPSRNLGDCSIEFLPILTIWRSECFKGIEFFSSYLSTLDVMKHIWIIRILSIRYFRLHLPSIFHRIAKRKWEKCCKVHMIGSGKFLCSTLEIRVESDSRRDFRWLWNFFLLLPSSLRGTKQSRFLCCFCSRHRKRYTMYVCSISKIMKGKKKTDLTLRGFIQYCS